jgi:RimJ/RimL family protein N-acetyltransferase
MIPCRIESNRLLLEPPTRHDARLLNDAVRASFPELRLWMPWAKRCPTLEETEAFCRKSAKAFQSADEYTFLIRLRCNGQVIGGTGLMRGDPAVPKFEIGYWLHTAFTGNGYATEAVCAVTQFARKHLRVRRLEIRTDRRNSRSAAVARRAGFKLEAVLGQDARDNRGRLRDTQLFVKLF